MGYGRTDRQSWIIGSFPLTWGTKNRILNLVFKFIIKFYHQIELLDQKILEKCALPPIVSILRPKKGNFELFFCITKIYIKYHQIRVYSPKKSRVNFGVTGNVNFILKSLSNVPFCIGYQISPQKSKSKCAIFTVFPYFPIQNISKTALRRANQFKVVVLSIPDLEPMFYWSPRPLFN